MEKDSKNYHAKLEKVAKIWPLLKDKKQLVQRHNKIK